MAEGWAPADATCAGVWTQVNDGPLRPPGCCEVHMLPWGHKRTAPPVRDEAATEANPGQPE